MKPAIERVIKGRLMTTQDGIEMVCFYPHQIKECQQSNAHLPQRIMECAKQATTPFGFDKGLFAKLILDDLTTELFDVAKGSKKSAWSDGVNHAAMLAQRMNLDLPPSTKEQS